MSPTPSAKAKSAAPLGVKSFQATQPNKSASSSANKSFAPSTISASTATTTNITTCTTTSAPRSAIDLSEQLSSIRKLTEASKTADYLLVNTELNNNTLLAPYRSPSQSTYSIRMDYRQQQQQQKATGLSTAPPTKPELKNGSAAGSAEPGVSQAQAKLTTSTSPFQVPSYTSLFAPNSFRLRASDSPTRNAGPPEQQQQQQPAEQGAANRRGSLKKQDQVDRNSNASPTVTYREARSTTSSMVRKANETSYAQANNERLVAKKARANEHEEEELYDEEEKSQIDEEEDEEEVEEDEVDERFPFSGSVASANRLSTRRSPESRTNRPQRAKQQHPKAGLLAKNTALGKQQKGANMAAFSNKALSGRASTSPNPHTKISFNTDSRPPSFNTCQEDGAPEVAFKKAHANHSYANSRTIDFYEEPACAKCECVSCCKKKKSQIIYQAHPNSFPPGHPLYISAKSHHAKTLALHLVLKSIILILLTVMLVGMMLGVLAACIYLPQMLDRFVSASKTFNVTIAG